ncbi:hypothetical protein IJG73_02015 [Candidatus Saccharibacteria bacterium]|nr:hypothetical protein [Candidatus Saccharibacteria bacterium]
MAKRLSKKSPKKPRIPLKTRVKNLPKAIKHKIKVHRERYPRVKLHKSFRRSYREDYARKLEVPGLMHHATTTFKVIFKNKKLFIPLIILAVVLNIILVGLMSEETYAEFQNTIDETNEQFAIGNLGHFAKAGLLLIGTVTTGGLTQSKSEVQQVFGVLIFLMLWLVTIYIIRHVLAGQKLKLRDALYNALAPLLSTLAVFLVILLQALPIIIVVVTYSAAVVTEFLNTPFYALVYFIFAALMILLSLYLISSSVLALVAVSAPGLYPMAALRTAGDLIIGRRIRFIIRLIYLVFVAAVIMVIVMLPIILIDLLLKENIEWLEGVPITPFFLSITSTFIFIYVSAYTYLFYRRMLDYEDE